MRKRTYFMCEWPFIDLLRKRPIMTIRTTMSTRGNTEEIMHERSVWLTSDTPKW